MSSLTNHLFRLNDAQPVEEAHRVQYGPFNKYLYTILAAIQKLEWADYISGDRIGHSVSLIRCCVATTLRVNQQLNVSQSAVSLVGESVTRSIGQSVEQLVSSRGCFAGEQIFARQIYPQIILRANFLDLFFARKLISVHTMRKPSIHTFPPWPCAKVTS